METPASFEARFAPLLYPTIQFGRSTNGASSADFHRMGSIFVF
jgi:hypothetical protein